MTFETLFSHLPLLFLPHVAHWGSFLICTLYNCCVLSTTCWWSSSCTVFNTSFVSFFVLASPTVSPSSPWFRFWFLILRPSSFLYILSHKLKSLKTFLQKTPPSCTWTEPTQHRDQMRENNLLVASLFYPFFVNVSPWVLLWYLQAPSIL
jgi:hypothetical protein